MATWLIIEWKLIIRCFNIIAFLGSTRKRNLSKESTRFFLTIDFSYEKKIHIHCTLSVLKEMTLLNVEKLQKLEIISLCSCHMLMRQTFDPIWRRLSSRKRPPRLDILGVHLPKVQLCKIRSWKNMRTNHTSLYTSYCSSYENRLD